MTSPDGSKTWLGGKPPSLSSIRPLRPAVSDRRHMPWDELVASLIMGTLSYTLWRSVKAFVEGVRGDDPAQ
jgi:hypothetical protein